MVSSAAMRRLMREINTLRTEPPEGIRISVSDEDMLDITGIIAGPVDTPYEGGYFRIKFVFTEEFPAAPPKCRFLTRIFHPNVSSTGEICVNTLKKDWKPTYGIAHILVTVKCLLIYPNPESALDEEAGKLLLENYAAYSKHAKVMTEVHAKTKAPPPEFAIPSKVPPETTASAHSSSATSVHLANSGTAVAPTPAPVPPPLAPPPSTAFSLKSPLVKPASTAPPLQPSNANTPTGITSRPAFAPTSNALQPSHSGNAPAADDRENIAVKDGKKRIGAPANAGEKRKRGLKRL
ncbi:hypothetical protein BOTBODRAFT_30768 [Botryobasidium botryosum FD-172 SS1]|uniref:E2 ubiquitin-conjugating enzyme n=1 Tax=Botryobasidium botryosum (strain FD-172 SS1) TaxID=930990 RepID=A0A067MX33_BOTB1|nr:hypothetical protein BOTBODRAFT_30768 [Botryobasidium botryosum FD-172 SS1]